MKVIAKTEQIRSGQKTKPNFWKKVTTVSFFGNFQILEVITTRNNSNGLESLSTSISSLTNSKQITTRLNIFHSIGTSFVCCSSLFISTSSNNNNFYSSNRVSLTSCI